jgi:acyl carrier protein
VGNQPHPLESRPLNETEFLRGLRDRLGWPDLTPETDLAGDNRWDSLAQVDVVMYVQDELGQTLAADDLQKLTKARELVGMVKDKLCVALRSASRLLLAA